MNRTNIEWTDYSWNPITGCSPISEGCRNCYAKRMANRLRGRYGYPKDDPFKVTFHPDRLNQPLKWKKPRRIFVVSMGDLFHKDVKKNWIDQIFHVMACSPQHIYMLLTKRPERMSSYWMGEIPIHGSPKGYTVKKAGKPHSKVIDHIWLGVTCENQAAADERIPILLQIPAAVRFVSIEPMLSEINLEMALEDFQPLNPDLSKKPSPIQWVIVGGESGSGARPMKTEWARNIKQQCQSAGVSFFMKQMSGKTAKERHAIPDDLTIREYPNGKIM